jgi:hypothetical protein
VGDFIELFQQHANGGNEDATGTKLIYHEIVSW